MKIITRSFLFVVLAGLLGVANASSLSFSTIKDANIHNNDTDPIGGSTLLLAPFTGSSYRIFSYIGFDISAFQALGRSASAVSFDLSGYGARTSLALNIFGLNDTISPNWLENSIDWSNAPGKVVDSIDPGTTTSLFGGPVSYTNNGIISFGGSFFEDFINNDTDGLITFILTQESVTSSNHAFNSRESSGNPGVGSPGDFAPALIIESVPLPGAFWLFASGLLGLFSFRKKEVSIL